MLYLDEVCLQAFDYYLLASLNYWSSIYYIEMLVDPFHIF